MGMNDLVWPKHLASPCASGDMCSLRPRLHNENKSARKGWRKRKIEAERQSRVYSSPAERGHHCLYDIDGDLEGRRSESE
jgi:hypothetical protein